MQLYWLALVLSAVCLVTEISCQQNQDDDRGLFPVIFNLANNARITSNATCGENGPERYCKLVEHVPGEPAPNPQCRVCDANSFDPRERHPIENAIDGTNSWWQSPTIANGMAYHYVTITLDLQQIFQIAYVIVKSANSPRPGNWILEKSNDGVTYEPWQYYAVSDSECLTLYNIEPTIGNPRYEEDDDVICTSFYSKLNPLENGEIHTSLVNGRPSVLKPTAELMEFTSARFIRLRLQRVRTLNADLMTLTSNEPGFIDPLVTRRYYYSIKDISIGGQCICFGHARVCPRDPITLASRCECEHNTCGDQCQECCPGFNQKAWKPGTQEESNICEPCNCHGHAVDCYFDQGVEDRGESLDIFGNYEGGGVCIGCRDNTMGINCELCIDRYYRPANVLRTDPDPCIPCSCNPFGIREVPDMAFGSCVKDDSQVNEGLNPGDCFCKEGYAGAQCDRCARGYQGFPDCEKCPCSIEGSVNEDVCEPPCVCKNNVEGENCDICKSGYYNLDGDNSVGCSACFCFGITTICSSAAVTQYEVQSLDGWAIGDKTGNVLVPVNRSPGQTILTVKHSDYLKQVDSDILYWYAPAEYLQNKLSSYGGMLTYTVRYNENSNANVSTPVLDSDVILKGSNGVTLKQRPSRWVVPDREETFQFAMQEDTWFHENSERYVSKVEFMTILHDVQALMIRATYHTAHAETSLYDVSLEYGVLDDNSTNSFGSVEQCSCPPGFEGLSCEECLPGYRRIDGKIFEGECVPCECNGHAVECDDFTGACIECQHFTTGKECAECDDGYYGDATQGSPEDCVRCACPLRESSNNFSPTCIPDGNGGFICDYCDIGYEGPRCDRCADGYYGNPLVLNDTCKPCMNICNGNLNLAMDGNCNTLTGECLRCAGNTAGPTCNRCADGFYGDAIFEKNCQLCQCYRTGSESEICDHLTGQCQCKPFVTGQFCNICVPGYWDILSGKGCGPCFCDPDGSVGPECDIVTGQCFCKPGVTGRTCDRCQPGYYNFTSNGCTLCDCERTGGSCDSNTGECICPPNTVGKRCQRCVPNAWGHDRVTGCKLCNCSVDGSRSQQCDVNTGECDCLEDYRGRQCDQCLFGYHDFPKCRQCSCSSDGTEPESCDEDGLCGCEDDGQCQCKLNVNSEKCDLCADDSFGLRDELETGCTQCFCFGIIDQCDQADYVKDEIVMTASTNGFFVSDDRSVVQTQSGVLFTPSEVRLNASLAYGEMTTRPTLYWNLPPAFLGNKITSYGGRIRYTVQYFGEDLGEDDVFDILIKGHYHTLVKSIPNPFSGVPQSFDLELIETEWQLRDAIYLETAPRDVFMMALYDVKAIMIRATYGPGMTELILSDLSFEVGIPRSDNPSLPEALGVEECECPDGYQGLSCQECAPGFVRVANGPYLGTCRPCTCNNHGAMCDSSTGVCEDCEHNTSGPMCEECADGFFGNATMGTPDDCQPCACPLVTSSNNFSPTCVLESDGGHRCTDCESGYIGRYCDTCEEGYFGNPTVPGSSCEPCDCNEYGSLNQTCDPVSGQCVCDEGLSGRACDVCQPRHVFTQQGCTSCDDTCTGLLLDDIDELTAKLETPNITGIVPAPWSRLRMMVNATQQLQPQLESYKNALEVAADMVNSLPDGVMGLEDDVMALLKRSEESQTRSSNTAEEANKSDRRAIEVEQLLQETLDKIKALIKDLEDLADSISSQPALENEALLEEAKRILDEIMARNFTVRDQDAMDELERAKESLRKAQRAFMDKVERT
ncbi:laminin subunit alpha-2-like [Ptychodera flava]|uniref:laminin subunit alpha-2-like n=1 Tax=Ptychodera flava TaxID=63121 RepID=UPI00396A7BF0